MKYTYRLMTNFLVVFLLIGFSDYGLAGGTQVKGTGSHQYEGRFKKKNYLTYKKQAIEKAKQSAWVRYEGTMSPAKMKSYQQMASSFKNDLERYIFDVVVLDESHDKASKTVDVIIRASVNTTAVDVALNVNSAVQQSGGTGSMFTFIFMARETSLIKSYDDKITKITAGDDEKSASEEIVVDGGSIATSQSSSSFSKSTTGGSTERKAEKVTYVVTSAQDIDAAMGETLTTAGYEVVDYGDVVSECGGSEPSDIRDEFSQSDDMSRQTRKFAIQGARECEVSYFATGTIDTGLSDIDPVTGNKRVYVSVRGQVWDVTRRLPKKVASVGPIQFSGLGPNPKVAKSNALILASREASRELVNQMNAKGLH
ncbi:MAG: hypothetical protein ACI9CE_002224 [Flavobacterium sp.]|jgi:hypothetical protein